MSTPVVTQAVFAAFVGGVQVRTAGDVLVTESRDNLCRVVEFELAEQPAAEPAEGDPVLVQWLDYAAGVAYDAFGGTVNSVEVESDPWAMVVRCTDQLERLRRVPTADHDLTGLTATAALREILDACNVAYDPADLAAVPYVLGARAPVKWLEGVPGSQVAAELNDVFGMILQTVGNDRVVWFRPDLPPADGAGAYRTFTKGTDADWFAHRRAHGDRDAIQNRWFATGAGVPCGPSAACTCTPWAKAVAANPQLGGRRIRVAAQSASSELIQDEALAEFVVRRQMGLTNRQPDTATLETVYDPNLHPGTKVGLVDPTFGIDAAGARYCTAIAVDATGPALSATLVCGPPGGAGTVTTGVEKVCNDTRTGVDWPGGFDPPDFGFPPLDGGLAFDPLDFFGFPPAIAVVGGTPEEGGGGGGPTDLLGVNLDNWEEVAPTFTNGPSTLVVSAEGGAYYPSISVDYATDWQVTATVVIDASANPHQLQVGIGNATGTALQFGLELWDTAPDVLFAYARSDSVSVSGTPFPAGSEIDVVLTWHADTETLDWSATDGITTYSDSVECFSGAPAFALHPMFGCTGTDPDFGGELVAYTLEVG